MSRFREDSRGVYQVQEWLGYGWLEHGFGTRHTEGWTEAESASLKQVHSADIMRVDEGRGCLGEGDALITNQPGVHLVIRTADCIPVLLVDPVHRAVAAIHAGWRGTAASIVAKTVDRMQAEYGSEPAELRGGIGPGIGACCYEVGGEVALQFVDWLPELRDCATPANLDLVEVNRRQLIAAGVHAVQAAALCTRCNEKDFHSFRRDRELSGRMVSAIAIVRGAELSAA